MNKKFVVAGLVASVLIFALDYVVHALILGADYQAFTFWRSPEEMPKHMPYMMAANVITGFGLVWVYDRGKQGKKYLGQGVRFGLGVSAIATVPNYLIYYALLPYGCAILCKQLVFGVAETVLVGIAVAWLRK